MRNEERGRRNASRGRLTTARAARVVGGLLLLLAGPGCGDSTRGQGGDPSSDDLGPEPDTGSPAADSGTLPDATGSPDVPVDGGADRDAGGGEDGGAGPADGGEPDLNLPDGGPDHPPLSFAPFVRGSFNDWQATHPLNYVGRGLYQGSVPIATGTHEFKIADANWSLPTIYSAHATEVVRIALDEEVRLVGATGYDNNTQLQLDADDEYTFSLRVAVAAGGPELYLTVTRGGTPVGPLPDDSREERFEVQPGQRVALPQGTPTQLGAAELFERMAIVIPPGERAQFVLGDNLDGYYDGRTHSYAADNQYKLKAGSLFSTMASLINGELQDATRAAVRTRLLPYGRRTEFADGAWEELVQLTHRRALVLAVHAETPGRLGLLPRLTLKRTSSTFTRQGDALVYTLDEAFRLPGAPPHLALAGDRRCSCRGADLTAQPALAAVVGLRESDVKPLCTTLDDETDFRLVLAFGATPEAAAAEATALARGDAIGDQQRAAYDLLTRSYLWTDDEEYNRALMWAKFSANTLVVEEFGRGIWAGLPWFKDNWGRDTFISLPGTLLATGHFSAAEEVLRNFAALQQDDPADPDHGRIPNRVAGPDDISYNTTDGTPWLVREVWETVCYTGELELADSLYPVVRRYLEGALTHHVDAEGFLTHSATDTWMDAAFGDRAQYPWSDRGDRAVEIQALWYQALRIGELLAQRRGEPDLAAQWREVADRLQTAFPRRFWDEGAAILADRIRADGSMDLKVRPNQLLLVSLPWQDRLLSDAQEATVVRHAVTGLLFPHGLTSLAQTHPYFHPYHDRQARYAKDAAYHNGTIWGWNAGPAVTALTRFGQVELAWALTRNLGRQILELGARGTMSELLDAFPAADGSLTPSGTFSQAWSVAEYVRNGYQDLAGFRPRLDEGRLELWPGIPVGWSRFDAAFPFGELGRLRVRFEQDGDAQLFTLELTGAAPYPVQLHLLAADRARWRVETELAPGVPVLVRFRPADGGTTLDGQPVPALLHLPAQAVLAEELQFVEPALDARYPALEQDDYLQGLIMRGEFE